MPYLTARALAGLKAYTYKPCGYTLLDKLHTPAWEWMASCLPLWLAPNLITLTGLTCVATAYSAAIIYAPCYVGEDGPLPRWLHALCALAVVLYVNLDCLDGKQARRTRSSSPLGQLFDHGCDALSLHALMANVQVGFGQRCGPLAAAMQLVMMWPWLLAHWEEYHTGVMVYGNGLVGILEANYAMAAVSLVSAVAGEQVWDTELPLPAVLALPPGLASQLTLRNLVFLICGGGSAVLGSEQLYRMLLRRPSPSSLPSAPPPAATAPPLATAAAAVAAAAVAAAADFSRGSPSARHRDGRPGAGEQAAGPVAASSASTAQAAAMASKQSGLECVEQLPPGERGHKELGMAQRWRHLLLLTSLTLLGAIWQAVPHPARWQCRLVTSSYGVTYALVASQLIVAHMAKEPFRPVVWGYCLVAGGLLLSLLNAGWGTPAVQAPVTLVLAALAAAAWAGFAHHVHGVIMQVCAYLNIDCFRIKRAAN